jgi:pimeloyl-ACP methyl ester carboxylesterase
MSYTLQVVDDILIRRRVIDDPVGSVWLLHAFADSGFAYHEVMDSQLGSRFDLYAPDFPGFGASPVRRDSTSLEAAADAMIALVDATTATGGLYLVAHSVASVVATWMAQRLGDRVNAVFSVEGNLTAEDAYFTGQAVEYDSPDDFKRNFLSQLDELAADDAAFSRYFAAASLAQPEALMGWGHSVARLGDAAGEQFAALECPKLYYWSDGDPPGYRSSFIADAALPNRQYPGDSHWPMIDQPERCSSDIADFFMEAVGTAR